MIANKRLGVDLSHHNHIVDYDFATERDGVSNAVVRQFYGKKRDELFHPHCDGLRGAGVDDLSNYNYLVHDEPIVEQVDVWISGWHERDDLDFMAVDVEDMKLTRAQVLQAFELLFAAGIPLGRYTSKWKWFEITKEWDADKGKWIALDVLHLIVFDWTAAYPRERFWIPDDKHALQYSEHGTLWFCRSVDLNLSLLPWPKRPTAAQAQTFDMLDYMRGDGSLYEYKFIYPNGEETQHRAQTQFDPHFENVWYLTKGNEDSAEFETMAVTANDILRGLDSSPGGGAMYAPWQNLRAFAVWCKRHWRVGDVFEGVGHFVQRYWKRSGKEIATGSGDAANRMKFAAHYDEFTTFTGFTFKDVVFLQGIHHDGRLGESFWFAPAQWVDNGQWWGGGMIAWMAPDWYTLAGKSAVSEIHAPGARPDNKMESVGGMELFKWA